MDSRCPEDLHSGVELTGPVVAVRSRGTATQLGSPAMRCARCTRCGRDGQAGEAQRPSDFRGPVIARPACRRRCRAVHHRTGPHRPPLRSRRRRVVNRSCSTALHRQWAQTAGDFRIELVLRCFDPACGGVTCDYGEVIAYVVACVPILRHSPGARRAAGLTCGFSIGDPGTAARSSTSNALDLRKPLSQVECPRQESALRPAL